MSKTSLATMWGRPHRTFPVKTHYDWPLESQLIGIEIELDCYNNDGASFPDANLLTPYWVGKSDGSLRNGMEYVLAQPLHGDDLSTAISSIMRHTGFKRHPYGSTHIHLDMQEEHVSVETLQAMVMLVFLLEDGIFQIADPAREWCGFTNRLSTAPGELLATVLNPQTGDDAESLFHVCRTSSIGRYYGLNMQALDRFGSLEFRYFPTAETEADLQSWVSLVMCFKKAALACDNLDGVYAVLKDETVFADFLMDFFPSWAETFAANVSIDRARLEFEKAMAHFPAYRRGVAPRSFQGTAITGRKNLAKFVRVPTREVPAEISYNVIVPGPDLEAPGWRTTPTGTIMLYSRTFYFNDGAGWRGMSTSSLDAYGRWNALHNSVPFASNLEARLREAIDTAPHFTEYDKERFSNQLRQVVNNVMIAGQRAGSNGRVARPFEEEDEE